MYAAPPSGDDADGDDRSRPTTADAPDESLNTDAPDASRADDPANEGDAGTDAEPVSATRETPSLEPTTATTDANWTGTVPADD